MNFKIVFDNSGDFIPFYAINPALLEYYVDQLTQHGSTKFYDQSNIAGKKIANRIELLHESIVEVNQWAQEIMDIRIDEYNIEGYLNQYNLNKIHSDYVCSKRDLKYDIDQKRKNSNFDGYAEIIHNMYPDEIRFPKLSDVLDKLGKEYAYHEINSRLHNVEHSFDQLPFRLANWVEFKNPFSTEMLTNDICNFRLGYRHVGRTLYDKYCYFDFDLEFDDENNFDELADMIEISLAPPQTIPLSQEYTKWCHLHNKVPSGNYLNIGNIPDLCENLHDYRLVIFRNLLENNSFTIHLN